MHRRDKTTDVMTQHLAECFVYLCRAGLASQPVSELRFYHVKGRLYIASLVVTLHESLLIVREVVIHLFPTVELTL
jgi:hypothetical protein